MPLPFRPFSRPRRCCSSIWCTQVLPGQLEPEAAAADPEILDQVQAFSRKLTSVADFRCRLCRTHSSHLDCWSRDRPLENNSVVHCVYFLVHGLCSLPGVALLSIYRDSICSSGYGHWCLMTVDAGRGRDRSLSCCMLWSC